MHLDVSALETFGEKSVQRSGTGIVDQSNNSTVNPSTEQFNISMDDVHPWMMPLNPMDALKFRHSQVDGAMEDNSSSSDEGAMVIGNIELSSINDVGILIPCMSRLLQSFFFII